MIIALLYENNRIKVIVLNLLRVLSRVYAFPLITFAQIFICVEKKDLFPFKFLSRKSLHFEFHRLYNAAYFRKQKCKMFYFATF